MGSEETAEVSVILIEDSDDEPVTSHVPLVTDFFRSIKKSAKNLGFGEKKFDSVDISEESNLEELSASTSKHSTDNVVERIPFIQSPLDEDFHQEFDSSNSDEAYRVTPDSDSDSDLDIPLSKRLAFKGVIEKVESSNDAKSNDTSVILVDEDVRSTPDLVDGISNDCFCIERFKKYDFTSISEYKNSTVPVANTEEVIVSTKGIKKKSTPKKKTKNDQSSQRAIGQTSSDYEKEQPTQDCRRIRNIDEAMKECTAVIDRHLCEKYFRNDELASVFHEKGVYLMTDAALTNNSVTWRRKEQRIEESISDDDSVQSFKISTDPYEDHMILILDVDTIRKMVNAFLDVDSPTLTDFVKETFDKCKKNLTLVFYGLETYYRRIINHENKKFLNGVFADQRQQVNRRKRQSLPPIRREDVEEMIVCMQITLSQAQYHKYRVTIRSVETPLELAKLIFLYTRTIAGKPLKENRLEEHGFAWYITGDVKGSVDVKCTEDITKLWTQQLMQFPKISLDIAKSIVVKYPSLFSLVSRYRTMNDRAAAESLLSDIKIVRRGEVTNRKVGMELSKRIYNCMTSTDPNNLLN